MRRGAIFLVTLLGVLAVLLAWPVYVGMNVERMAQAPQSFQVSHLRIDHQPLDYQRGVYTARSESLLRIIGEGLELELRLEHLLRHRMLGATVTTRLVGVRETGDGVVAWEPVLLQARPRAESWVGLGGGVSSRLSSRAARVVLSPGQPDLDGTATVLDLAAGQGGLAYTRERMLLSFDTEGFGLFGSRQNLSGEQVYFSLLVQPGPGGDYAQLPDYDLSFGVENLAARAGDAEFATAHSLRAAAWQNSTGKRMDSLLRLRAAGIRGLGLEFDHLEVSVNAQRWPRTGLLRALQDWREGGKWSAAEGRKQLESILVEMAGSDSHAQVLFELNDELSRKFRLALDLAPGADADARSVLSLEGWKVEAEMHLGHDLFDEVLATVHSGDPDPADGTASIRLWLDQAVREGWVVQAENHLSSRVELGGGRLMINGRDHSLLLLALLWAINSGAFE